MKCWFVRFYPELLLFYDEDKALIVVGVEVAHLHRRLLLLPDSLPLPIQQLDLNVRIWRERKACVLEKRKKILARRSLQTLDMCTVYSRLHAEIFHPILEECSRIFPIS